MDLKNIATTICGIATKKPETLAEQNEQIFALKDELFKFICQHGTIMPLQKISYNESFRAALKELDEAANNRNCVDVDKEVHKIQAFNHLKLYFNNKWEKA